MSTQQKSLSAYLLGFFLCVIFTICAFGLVMFKPISGIALTGLLASLAIAQLITQCICFLGLNNTSEGKWHSLSFLFALLIISILVAGSLWIMYNLDYNMMH